MAQAPEVGTGSTGLLLADQLVDIVGAGHVLVGDAIVAEYTHDEALSVAGELPAAVARPGNAAEVSAVLALATAGGVPVTARGTGTGLSGASIPRPGGLVLSFERMNRILEIDTENHVAVVQPGVTLAQLDEATAAHGLVYPVYPGEYGASLGGNVATNAGGMRAVRYGVTRTQVLGLEAVLATGEVLRTGGKVTKASTGYDLTQLIVGSEGTLAIVTEATLRLYPRAPHQATVLAPFASVDEVARAVPKIVASGVGPLILEYIDGLTMAAITHAQNLELPIPPEIKERTQAYLLVMLESRAIDRLTSDVEEVGGLLDTLGAVEVYVLEGIAARRLIEARERAFWTSKAVGANDIVDVVVPRSVDPGVPRRGQGDRRAAPVLRRRLRPRRGRQRAPLGVPGRPRRSLPTAPGALRGQHEAGRAHLGRARCWPHQEAVLPRAHRPDGDRADAEDQSSVRPGRDPQSRRAARLTARLTARRRGTARDERRGQDRRAGPDRRAGDRWR